MNEKRTMEALIASGIPQKMAEEIVGDGYLLAPIDGKGVSLVDTYYGDVFPLGFLLDKQWKKRPVETFVVHSLNEAEEIIRTVRRARGDQTDFVFRGVNKEFFLNHPLGRRFRNPYVCTVDEKEPSLLPSYWRIYRNEEDATLEDQLFISLWGQRLVYHGMDLFRRAQKNIERYGVHSISDLEDDDDPENQELYKRSTARISQEAISESAVIAQHYGLKSRGLDVTFDLATALFFAAYRYTSKGNGKSTYIVNVNPDAAVYCILNREQLCEINQNTSSKLFEHIVPERPRRQKCGMWFTYQHNKNAVGREIVCRLKLAEDFNASDLPAPEFLFPSRQDDAFYDLLLKTKEDLKESPFDAIVDYEF